MDTLFANAAGLDVHRKSIACAVRCGQASGQRTTPVRSFGTMTGDLRAWADYVRSRGVTPVALEAPGGRWKPVWDLLEGRFTRLWVHPRHLTRVPGRTTDVRDAPWLAQLLHCGLLQASFVPPRALRPLRDLTRQRPQLSGEHPRVANRIHKVLEDANRKLPAVAADVLGTSGRALLAAWIAGEQDPEKLAGLALGLLRKKRGQLRPALDGHGTEHHRWRLARLLSHLGYLERQSEQFDARMGQRLGERLAPGVSSRRDGIPGVNRRTIEPGNAAIGADRAVFPDEHPRGSWCGICPGHEASAGQRRRSRTGPGNRGRKRALTAAAWAAARAKGSYFQAPYRRRAARRGQKRALVAVGHSLRVVIYHMLKNNQEYQELGPEYFARLEPERLRRHRVRRLQALGYDVTLAPREAQDSAG